MFSAFELQLKYSQRAHDRQCPAVWMQVMLKCAPQLREDQREWAAVVHSIIDSSVAANRWLLRLLSQSRPDEDTTFGEDVIDNFLVWCDQVQ